MFGLKLKLTRLFYFSNKKQILINSIFFSKIASHVRSKTETKTTLFFKLQTISLKLQTSNNIFKRILAFSFVHHYHIRDLEFPDKEVFSDRPPSDSDLPFDI